MPGKAFDLSFEMPEPDVGIMTFNRCVAVDQWETMGRPDILEKNCHSTCPKSMIQTTKMYNPNMKVDILAIPPRRDPGDVCCKWRFSMRDEERPRVRARHADQEARLIHPRHRGRSTDGVGSVSEPRSEFGLRGASDRHDDLRNGSSEGPRVRTQPCVSIRRPACLSSEGRFQPGTLESVLDRAVRDSEDFSCRAVDSATGVRGQGARPERPSTGTQSSDKEI